MSYFFASGKKTVRTTRKKVEKDTIRGSIVKFFFKRFQKKHIGHIFEKGTRNGQVGRSRPKTCQKWTRDLFAAKIYFENGQVGRCASKNMSKWTRGRFAAKI